MDRKGFTLIEVLAVIIILGVIMSMAIPNVVSVLDRNKEEAFIEDAKSMITLTEYTMRKDTSIEFPKNNGEAILLTLEYLNTDDISNSPYDIPYNVKDSFVVIKNVTNSGVTEYKYYVQLLACDTDSCSTSSKIRGIVLTDNISSSTDVKKINDKTLYSKKSDVNAIKIKIGVTNFSKIFG